MNAQKICFITATNNHELYQKCLAYINQLAIPTGFTIEISQQSDCPSLASAYNKALQQSDAKYKVYLHQDTYIINHNFIHDILQCFTNPQIGLLGVIGSITMPANGIWWESTNTIGRVFDSHRGFIEQICFSQPAQLTQDVQCIDGLIMATQYDLPWREDLFDGWHFYDAAQSMEFIRAGYSVAVPQQAQPWCIHDCGIVNVANGYEHYRQRFIAEYLR